MRTTRWIAGIAAGLFLGAAGCGGGGYGGSGGGPATPAATPTPGGTVTPAGTPTAGGFVITIAGMRYSPTDLSVPPGATITVVNDDAMPHSLTSEAARGAYTPGAVAGISFDTGTFSSGQRTILIPTTATPGTVIPFYCTVHLATMATPNGSITIDPAAQPTATPTPAPTASPVPSMPPAPGY